MPKVFVILTTYSLYSRWVLGEEREGLTHRVTCAGSSRTARTSRLTAEPVASPQPVAGGQVSLVAPAWGRMRSFPDSSRGPGGMTAPLGTRFCPRPCDEGLAP